MFLTGLCIGLFIGANIGVVIAGMLMNARQEQRISRSRYTGLACNPRCTDVYTD